MRVWDGSDGFSSSSEGLRRFEADDGPRSEVMHGMRCLSAHHFKAILGQCRKSLQLFAPRVLIDDIADLPCSDDGPSKLHASVKRDFFVPPQLRRLTATLGVASK